MEKQNNRNGSKTFLGMPMRWDSKNAFKGFWDKSDDRLFPPKHFGIGWNLNFHALLKLAGIIDAKSKEFDRNSLPANLPVPQDDGACDHLTNMTVPEIRLRSTGGHIVNLASLAKTPTVLFFYPRTGEAGKPAPEDWNLIPGARGCTPQSCGFRDHYSEFKAEGYQVRGVSTQTSDYQKEFIVRNHIPFEFLSDADFQLTDALKLPTFVYGEMRLLRRMALVLNEGQIVKVFYPVFPPNKNAETVLNWIKR